MQGIKKKTSDGFCHSNNKTILVMSKSPLTELHSHRRAARKGGKSKAVEDSYLGLCSGCYAQYPKDRVRNGIVSNF